MFTLLSIHTFACDVLVLLGTESTESLKWLISFKQYMNIKWLSQCVKSSGSQCKPFNGFITFDCHVSCSLFCAGSVIEFCDAIITWSIHKWVSSTRHDERAVSTCRCLISCQIQIRLKWDKFNSVTSVINRPERLNTVYRQNQPSKVDCNGAWNRMKHNAKLSATGSMKSNQFRTFN